MEVTPPRRAASEVLRRVFEQDAWADRAFPAAAERHALDARERPQAQRLAYGAVQRRGTADHLIRELSSREPADLDPPIAAALRLGIFELLFASATPDHAAVDQGVELAKSGMRGPRAERAAGFVNALLRRTVRERDDILAALDDSTPEGAAVAHSYPEWQADTWWEELGPDATRALMEAMNRPAETALRVNLLETATERVLDRLAAAGEEVRRPDAEPLLAQPEALIVPGRLGAATRELFAAGHLVAQSRGSQAAVALLDPRPGERILDLCAAPGIKTTAIAARMRNRGEIVAVEQHPGRADALRELSARLGASCVRVLEADAAIADLGEGYDRVLVDPPCSDLGALASRPDARWRKSPALIERVVPVQEAILARGARAVAPSGTLVYSTCTISHRENEERIAALLAAAGGLQAEDLGAEHPGLASSHDRRFLQIRPDRDRTDGFFLARLRRGLEGSGS